MIGLAQRYMEQDLALSVDIPGVGTVLEVKEERGLGTTLDVILYNGTLPVGDEVAIARSDGVSQTKVRSLLKPRPMKEILIEDRFGRVKSVAAAAGIKVSAPNLEGVIAGSPIRVIRGDADTVMEEIRREMGRHDAARRGRDHCGRRQRRWAVAGVARPTRSAPSGSSSSATGRSGPEVLALFPVEVGRAPARLWDGRPAGDESSVDTTEEAESLASQLVADDRFRFGVAALTWDPELAAIARAHSAEMAEEGYFAHISPRTGSVADRLRRAGYPASFAAENIAIAPTLGEAQESLMRSPGHRAAVLTPEATHVGIGVVTRRDPDHGTVHHVTQLFVRREAAEGGG